MIVVEAAKEAL